MTCFPARLSSGTKASTSPLSLAAQASRCPFPFASVSMNFASEFSHSETWEACELIRSLLKRPSSILTMHLPHRRLPPQTDSISTPSSREASSSVFPSSTSPLLPEGWKTILNFPSPNLFSPSLERSKGGFAVYEYQTLIFFSTRRFSSRLIRADYTKCDKKPRHIGILSLYGQDAAT